MADLLSICQHAARKCQIEIPTGIIASTNETAKILLACAQDEGEALSRRPVTAWKALIREHTFDIALSGTTDGTTANKLVDSTTTFTSSDITVGDIVKNTTDTTESTVTAIAANELTLAGDIFVSGEAYTIFRQAHSLPSDFKYQVDNTLWDRDAYWNLRGPLSQVEWQTYKSSVLGDTATVRRRFQYRSNAATTDPEVKFYIDPKPSDDATLVFEYVTTGWCKDATAGTVNTEWQKDTDIPLLDDYLMRLGIIWRTLNRLGLAYEEELDEYDREVENAIGRDGGGRVLDLSRRPHPSLISTCNVPDTGFGQ